MSVVREGPWDPDTYLDFVRSEVPAYDELQDVVAEATDPVAARRILDLGTGTGMTAKRVLDRHPGALLVGVDESAAMLSSARSNLPAGRVELEVRRLEDPLPAGPFDLVVSVLAVHHLDGPAKADLFRRLGAVLAIGGRFVLGDVVRLPSPTDEGPPSYEGHDRPDTVADQLTWLREAGFSASAVWERHDLAVIVADRNRGAS
jgi:tRNA (cmo5U34)-methyltransferase